MQDPSRPPVLSGVSSNIISISYDVYQSMKSYPRLSRQYSIELDECTVQNKGTCVLNVRWLTEKNVSLKNIPCEFHAVLRAVKLLSQPGEVDFPRLLKQSVLDGGGLKMQMGWNQDQQTGLNRLRNMVQRTENWTTNCYPCRDNPCLVPVFCIVDIPLDVRIDAFSPIAKKPNC